MDGVTGNKSNTPLSPANRAAKGPLDRFLFRGKPPVVEKPAKPKLPEPEVIVPDTTDCIDLSSSNSSLAGNNTLKNQVIEETLAEGDDSENQAGFTLSDSDSENEERSGQESSKSGKHSALGVNTAESGTASSLTHSANKKRRRLSLDEKRAREAEMERRKAEREKKKEEKERHKMELESAKKARVEERQKKIEAMKEAEKEREEKRKQAELEKEEKRKQAEVEREEKRKQAEREKEEKRKQREAEKQMQEDAKKRKLEEEQLKKSKAAEMFKKHFIVVQGSNKDGANAANESADTSYKSFGPFKMFQLRPNQRLAPICRLSRDERELAKSQLDKFLAQQDEKASLLKEHRSGSRKFHSSGQTYPKPEVDVIQLDENHNKSVMRAKLLQFTEDIRPPYFGTWRKRTKFISGRHPFGQDTGTFDYECDSAADWEEPEDGEDILSSSKESGEEDTDAKSSDEEEDGFIVPHGYLSTDEEEAREEEEQLNLPPSDQKVKNRIQDSYELGFKKLGKSLKPIFFGPELVDSGRPLPVDLSQFQPLFYDPIPPDFEPILCGEVVVPDPELPKEQNQEKPQGGDSTVPGGEAISVKKSKLSKEADGSGTPGQPGAAKVHKKPIPEEGIPALIRYVHGNSAGIGRLIEGFIASFAQEPVIGCEVSKRQVERQIFAIGERTTKSDRYPSACWYVRDDVLAKYNLADLPVPNLTHAPSPAPKRSRKLPKQTNGAGSEQDGTATTGTKTAPLPVNTAGQPPTPTASTQPKISFFDTLINNNIS